MKWTAEADAMLTDLHAAKMLFGDIAVVMTRSGYPVTRNACIGRAHRIGLYTRAPTPGKPKKPKQKRSPRAHRRAVMEPNRDDIIRERRPVNRTGLLIDFDPDQCRWPLEEISPRAYRYCTNDKVHPGLPYCLDHHRIAHPSHKG